MGITLESPRDLDGCSCHRRECGVVHLERVPAGCHASVISRGERVFVPLSLPAARRKTERTRHELIVISVWFVIMSAGLSLHTSRRSAECDPFHRAIYLLQ